MEYEDIIINENQNTAENGFGDSHDARSKWRQMWADFYQVSFFQTYKYILHLLMCGKYRHTD